MKQTTQKLYMRSICPLLLAAKSGRKRWTERIPDMKDCMQNFSRESPKKTPFMKYKPRCEFNVKWTLESENANWIQLAENRDVWWVMVNTVIKLRVP